MPVVFGEPESTELESPSRVTGTCPEERNRITAANNPIWATDLDRFGPGFPEDGPRMVPPTEKGLFDRLRGK